MASPFPGMDPYLEHPAYWPGIHQRYITRLADRINELLPERYAADIGQRFFVNEEGRREPFVEILTAGESGQVVTVIEILSPTNKMQDTDGWDLYGRKQGQILASPIHLVEIDLLREGRHRAAVPLGVLPEKHEWDYLVNLHRGGSHGKFEVWTVPLMNRLPRVLVPLAEGDPDLVVDLQEIFTHCYDVGKYARRIDYRQPCQPPLEGERAVWADALLKEKKLR